MLTTVAATTTTSRSDSSCLASRRQNQKHSRKTTIPEAVTHTHAGAPRQVVPKHLSVRAGCCSSAPRLARERLALVGARRARWLLVLLCIVLACSSCARCDSTSEGSAPPVAQPPPAKLPLPLLAEVVAPEPQSLWNALRLVSGPWGAALPSQAALGLAGGLGLPTLTASALDLASPAVGVLMLSAEQDPIVVLAIHLRSGRELVAQLTSGKAPPFVGKPLQYGVTPLERLDKRKNGFALCVYRNYLVVGSTDEATGGAARFVVEELAQKKHPDGLVVFRAGHDAVAGPLSSLLRARWASYHQELRSAAAKARAVQGRPPDFGDPTAVMGAFGTFVDAVLALLASTDEVTARIDVQGDDWRLHVEAIPQAKGALAELLSNQKVGAATPLGDLPADTVAAMLTRSDAAARRASAADTAAQVKTMLGDRLTAEDQTALSGVLEAWAEGRGDVTKLAFVAGARPGLLVSGSTHDAERLEASLNGLPKAFGARAISEPMMNLLGPVNRRAAVESIGSQQFHGYRFQFGVGGHLAELLPSGFTMLWHVTERDYHIVMSPPPAKELFASALGAERPLAASPRVAESLERVKSASVVVLLRPVPLGLVREPPGKISDAPVIVSAGKSGPHGFVDAELPVDAIRAFVTTHE